MRKCVMVLALMAVVLLSGCAAQYPNNEFVGRWQAVKGAMGGVEVNLEDIDSHIALMLEDSGKAVVEIGETEHEGKWSPLEDDKGITLVVDGETIECAKVHEDTLKGPLQGITMTFEKEDE
ncbi:MAG: hypothetical protein UDG94_03585 [Peptococcaceae bacterium]|nr:hypothetical protein [Peptococcaceae bacterium]